MKSLGTKFAKHTIPLSNILLYLLLISLLSISSVFAVHGYNYLNNILWLNKVILSFIAVAGLVCAILVKRLNNGSY